MKTLKGLLSKGLIIANVFTYLIMIYFLIGNSNLQSQIGNTKNLQTSYENQFSTCSVDKTAESKQLESCKYTFANSESEITTLQHDYSVCQSDLSTASSSYNDCSSSLSDNNNRLNSCNTALNNYKNSLCGIYSQHMHSSDTTIQTAAATAKTEIENYLSNLWNMFSTRKQIADSCLNKLDSVSYTKLIGAMGSYYWIVGNIQYINTPFSSSMRDDTTVLQVKAGQCNEQALLLASMLRSQGIQADIIFLTIPSTYCSSNCGHAITIAYIDGLSSCSPGWQWGNDTVLLDPTFQGEFGAISYMDTSVSLEKVKLIDIPSSMR